VKNWWAVLILGFVGFVTSFGAHVVAVNLPVYAEQVGVGTVWTNIDALISNLARPSDWPLTGE
jgi:hypothetical protein